MRTQEKVRLTRDCDAIQVPSGIDMVLSQGTEVDITQALGDTFTVITDRGLMVRIANKDADALGKEARQGPATGAEEARTPEALEKLVWEELRTCYDPEIPVNIVELGLIYHCRVLPLEEGSHKAEVRMTLTAPGCGMGDILRSEAEQKILRLPTIKEADVQVVFEPPWSMDMMSEAARLELGMM